MSDAFFALIVEDTPELGELIKLTLMHARIESYHAANGRLALEFLEQQRIPDIMILDIGMPGMSGWEVLDAVKTRFPETNFPVVVLTAFDDPANKLIGKFQNRVFRYLTKPYEPSTVLNTVREALGIPK